MRLKLAEKIKPRYRVWLHRIIVAGLITVAIQLIFLYVKYGNIFVELHYTSAIEFTFTFLYFLSLFSIYPRISRFLHSPVFNRLESVYINILEGITVAMSTFLLITIMKILPIWILLLYLNARYEDMNASFDIDALRRDVIVHAVLGLFIYYFVERERIRKQIQAEALRYAQLQKEEFKGQLENLKNQVNPHFLFNNLEALDSLIEKDPEEAVKFVNRLSYVYRSFLDREQELGTLAKEMELVEAYIYLLKTRFGDKIQFNMKIPPEYLSLQIPPGCLQVLIENAVLYNEISREKPLHINISIHREKLIVRNNLYEIRREKTSGAGLKDLIERYEYFTTETIEVEETGKELIVKLPLLKVEEYNGSFE